MGVPSWRGPGSQLPAALAHLRGRGGQLECRRLGGLSIGTGCGPCKALPRRAAASRRADNSDAHSARIRVYSAGPAEELDSQCPGRPTHGQWLGRRRVHSQQGGSCSSGARTCRAPAPPRARLRSCTGRRCQRLVLAGSHLALHKDAQLALEGRGGGRGGRRKEGGELEHVHRRPGHAVARLQPLARSTGCRTAGAHPVAARHPHLLIQKDDIEARRAQALRRLQGGRARELRAQRGRAGRRARSGDALVTRLHLLFGFAAAPRPNAPPPILFQAATCPDGTRLQKLWQARHREGRHRVQPALQPARQLDLRGRGGTRSAVARGSGGESVSLHSGCKASRCRSPAAGCWLPGFGDRSGATATRLSLLERRSPPRWRCWRQLAAALLYALRTD